MLNLKEKKNYVTASIKLESMNSNWVDYMLQHNKKKLSICWLKIAIIKRIIYGDSRSDKRVCVCVFAFTVRERERVRCFHRIISFWNQIKSNGSNVVADPLPWIACDRKDIAIKRKILSFKIKQNKKNQHKKRKRNITIKLYHLCIRSHVN